ncbi:MAG: hypothetical protein LBT00_15240, partial [Spirochaetaceae bacterium]|nr:hypothetical protein [Spirochaetaceae bacterium]
LPLAPAADAVFRYPLYGGQTPVTPPNHGGNLYPAEFWNNLGELKIKMIHRLRSYDKSVRLSGIMQVFGRTVAGCAIWLGQKLTP